MFKAHICRANGTAVSAPINSLKEGVGSAVIIPISQRRKWRSRYAKQHA
jgi:hypothetical protein